jgi:2-C-methyl-D-erythritol 4-phosphate cytidylyltransferase
MDVKIINGSRYNIKITVNEDLALAKAMFDAKLI